jgi:ABC-2 type transport system permease protein
MTSPVHRAVDGPATETASSVIHDLGYQRYDGPREGAAGARRALFWQGFRAMFGIGRPLKSKAIPVFVVLASLLPCLAILAAASAASGQVPVGYAQVITPQLILYVLFMAAQGPELLSRDQQHRVMPLMFTRNVTREQYALTRLLSVWCAMLCITLAPLLLLWIGQIGIEKDPSAVFATVGPRIGPVLIQGTVSAWVIGGLGAGLASLSPRRAYATAAVIGFFLVSIAIGEGLRDLAGMPYFLSALINPIHGLTTLAQLLFNEPTRAMELETPPSLGLLMAIAGVLGALGSGLLVWRSRRVSI